LAPTKSAETVAGENALSTAANTAKGAGDAVTKSPKSDGPADTGVNGAGGGGSKSSSPAPSKRTTPSKKKTSVGHPYHQFINSKHGTTQSADRVILLAGGAALGIVAVSYFAGNPIFEVPGKLFRVVGGNIVVSVGLLILAEFEPDIAAMFALLMLTKLVLDHGTFLARGVNKLTGAQPGAALGAAVGGASGTTKGN
jgi:hypothetical protein